MTAYPKRLIEVDLPIARISAHARREKSIRHGHISTLHIWWARRPLAACRAVICASLWPDPEDLTAWLKEAEVGGAKGESGPEIRAPRDCKRGEGVTIRPRRFLDEARKRMTYWAQRHMKKASAESMPRQVAIQKDPTVLDDPAELRRVLLDFIADFANWDNSTDPAFLETARALTQAAHEALGGEQDSRPLVVDPFAGGGSIPLEALRVGADAFASDLNPVAVLLNKVVLEYIPKYGQKLTDEVRKWGKRINEQAKKELEHVYVKGPSGATPIAYLWARTIECEGPACGYTVPLMQSFWIARRRGESLALVPELNPRTKRVVFHIRADLTTDLVNAPTAKRGSATCLACGFTTHVSRVREQLRKRRGGSDSAQLTAVVWNTSTGVAYREPTADDLAGVSDAAQRLGDIDADQLPTEATPSNTSHRAVGSPYIYGMLRWCDLFAPRQLLTLTTMSRLIRTLPSHSPGIQTAVRTCLALALGKMADYLSTLSTWRIQRCCVRGTFGRQALGFTWDFGEMNPFADSAADFSSATDFISKAVAAISAGTDGRPGSAHEADATQQFLPNDSAHLLLTDPPYYDSVPFAEIADFFYVWLKRCLPDEFRTLFAQELTPKEQQAIVWHPNSREEARDYVHKMTLSMEATRLAVTPDGVGVVFFAHKSTSGWESQLASMIAAGWTITASWPLDTERAGRFNSQEAASLASSVQLVCRPREDPDGSVREDDVGEWREVLAELPQRMHAWMPRLAKEGVVGADAIFACIGPALEIFSRYSRVEKASGEIVTLGEYLEQVWAAVSKEALSLLFKDADASGLESDARLTAMWLWTLGAGANVKAATTKGAAAAVADGDAKDDNAGDDENGGGKKASGKPSTGYELEFDAARKIAQGLGAHLDKLSKVVEVKGDKARLLSVSERTRHLFGKDAEAGQPRGRRKKKDPQLGLFAELEAAEEMAESGDWALGGMPMGQTALDRTHQAMILFAAGRGEALKRFLVEDGAGTDARFWKLAQSLSALYPSGSDEKRWVDGVLGRKKGLGL